MTVTVSSSNFIRYIAGASSTTHNIVLPSDVPAGASIVVGILDRADETTTLTSVADPVNGTWDGATLRQGPTDFAGGTSRTWLVVLTNSAALTGSSNRTLTVTVSSSLTLHAAAGWVSSDAGALTYDAVATIKNDAANDTNHDSNTVAATGAGVAIGFHAINNAQTSGPTVDGAGESNLTTGTETGRRTYMYGETFAGAGNYGFEITYATSCAGMFFVVALKEPVGAANAPRASFYSMLRRNN